MSERDELAKMLFVTDNRGAFDPEMEWRTAKPEYQDYAYKLADAILAAGYRKPRIITTAEELDGLEVGAVILDADEVACQQMKLSELWEAGGEIVPANLIPLPATVLYEPRA